MKVEETERENAFVEQKANEYEKSAQHNLFRWKFGFWQQLVRASDIWVPKCSSCSGWHRDFGCGGAGSGLQNSLSTQVGWLLLSSTAALLHWETRDSPKHIGPDFLSVRSLSLIEVNSWAELTSQFSHFFSLLILSFQCLTTLKKK